MAPQAHGEAGAAAGLGRWTPLAGRKIDMARKAVDHAIRLLNDRDHLALVCYDTEIDTLLGATPATPEAKTLARSRLRAIDARGSTDLCGGWLRGAEEVGVCPRSAEAGTIDALAAELEAEQPDYSIAMSALDLKARHVASYYQSAARDSSGKALRRDSAR